MASIVGELTSSQLCLPSLAIRMSCLLGLWRRESHASGCSFEQGNVNAVQMHRDLNLALAGVELLMPQDGGKRPDLWQHLRKKHPRMSRVFITAQFPPIGESPTLVDCVVN